MKWRSVNPKPAVERWMAMRRGPRTLFPAPAEREEQSNGYVTRHNGGARTMRRAATRRPSRRRSRYPRRASRRTRSRSGARNEPDTHLIADWRRSPAGPCSATPSATGTRKRTRLLPRARLSIDRFTASTTSASTRSKRAIVRPFNAITNVDIRSTDHATGRLDDSGRRVLVITTRAQITRFNMPESHSTDLASTLHPSITSQRELWDQVKRRRR